MDFYILMDSFLLFAEDCNKIDQLIVQKKKINKHLCVLWLFLTQSKLPIRKKKWLCTRHKIIFEDFPNIFILWNNPNIAEEI